MIEATTGSVQWMDRGGKTVGPRRRTRLGLEPLEPRQLLSNDVNGLWEGTLSQPTGGIQTSYTFEMDLVDTNGQVTGVSLIELDNPEDFGVMAVTGTVTGSTFTFQESSILFQALPSNDLWLLKSGSLNISASGPSLSGSWTGTASGNQTGSGTLDVTFASVSTADLAGSWTGTLQENDNVHSFLLDMNFTQNQDMITGTETIYRADNTDYYATFQITGIVIGQEFIFQEGTILDQVPPPGSSWLIKSGNLNASMEESVLTGPWSSEGFYDGTITLKYQAANGSSSPTPTPSPTTPTTPTSTPTPTPTPVPTATPTPAPVGPIGGTHATRTVLTARPRSAHPGRPVALTATVKAVGHGGGTPGGSVTFLDGAVVLGTLPLDGDRANLSVPSLPVGRNLIRVEYTSDNGFAGSTAAIVETVRPNHSRHEVV